MGNDKRGNLDPTSARPTLFEALQIWLNIGFLSFGGPAGQIALMHREIVDHKKWLSEQQFLNALSFCMLLPGPEAMQLATYSRFVVCSAWRAHDFTTGARLFAIWRHRYRRYSVCRHTGSRYSDCD